MELNLSKINSTASQTSSRDMACAARVDELEIVERGSLAPALDLALALSHTVSRTHTHTQTHARTHSLRARRTCSPTVASRAASSTSRAGRA
eukprot:6185173-Pleurochrysis_carterae.AAC.2